MLCFKKASAKVVFFYYLFPELKKSCSICFFLYKTIFLPKITKTQMHTSAMIFAAGLGTRLYPLTANKPKALVEYQGKTLLEHAITKVMDAGIQHIVINVHHFGEQIIDFVNQHHFNAKIDISDEREMLMDTAGGLKHAEHFFTNCDQILLYNVDVISSIDLKRFAEKQKGEGRKEKGIRRKEEGNGRISPSNFEGVPEGRGSLYDNIATLAVQNRKTTRYFLFKEPEMRLCGWENTQTHEKKICYEVEKSIPLAFSGIHIVDKKILDFIPKNEKISFTPLYLELAKNHVIQGYLHDEDSWQDMGKLEGALRTTPVQLVN